MKSNDIILNSQNLTVSKKNLKKSLAAMGIDITLSNSANVLAQTFGFKHEHELQENLKSIVFQQDTYELSELFEMGIHLVKKYQNNASDIFDSKNSGMYSFSERSVYKIREINNVFKSNKDLIIKNGINLQHLQVVRSLYNQVTLRNLGKENHDLYLFYLFYNYHNVEPYFLKDNVIRKDYYLKPEFFEHEIAGCYSDYHGSYSQTKPVNRSVESYDKLSGILIKRDIYSIGCEKIDVGQSFHTHSYAVINYKQSQ